VGRTDLGESDLPHRVPACGGRPPRASWRSRSADGPDRSRPWPHPRQRLLALHQGGRLRANDAATEDLALLAGLGEEVFEHDISLPDTVHYAFALQAYLSGDDRGVRMQVRPALANAGRDDHSQCLRQPPVRLLDRLISDDADGFNRVLAEALNLYWQYYSVADRENDHEALISIDALGLACLAHDRAASSSMP
jgi:hypothetical protein